MTARRMLFSAPMVRAILAGQKTVTRRLVTWRPGAFSGGATEPGDCPDAPTWEPRGSGGVGHDHPGGGAHYCPVLRMPAMEGDTIRVLETWAPCPCDCDAVYYRATFEAGGYPDMPVPPSSWRPSIHMPDRAVRLRLHVESVRVERLWSITPEDVHREGVDPGYEARWDNPMYSPELLAFSDLWDKLNSKRAPWRGNPWVYRIAFRRLP